MFKVGQQVICINDNFDNVKDKDGILYPVFGHTYTVRSIDEYGVLLKEIINKKFKWMKHGGLIAEPHFKPERFVPIIDEPELIEQKQTEYA